MANKTLANASRWRQPHILPVFYTTFLAIGLVISLLSVLSSHSEEKRAFFLGYSFEKILLGAGLLFLLLLFVALIVKLVRQPDWSRHLWESVFKSETTSAISLFGAVIVFAVCWIILFLPFYRVGRLSGYIIQLEPVIVWLAVVSAATMLLISSERGKEKESFKSIILSNKTAVWMAIIIFGLFLLAGIVIFVTGLGASNPEDYWYSAGVPILGLQIFFALLSGIFFYWLELRWKARFPLKLDLLICLALWLVTAWLWAREPMLPNYFMPDTADNVMYPYSDSATFDLNSQYALIGQGLFNDQFFDRSLYSAFLTYLHIIFEQNYAQLLTTQAIIYAVFPWIIYLLVKELFGGPLGISAAVLILLRGINALVSATWIDLASPKMILTDFPTAIGVALFVLLVVKWLKEPVRVNLAAWAGGVLGMTLMLRTHVLLLLPFVFAYLILAGWKMRWNYRIVASVALVIGMLAATTPWDLRNYSNGLPMFYMYYARIENVLRQRYGIERDSYVPPSYPSVVSGNRNSRARAASDEVIKVQAAFPLVLDRCESRVCMIANHMFHNLITSVLFLPTSLELDNLWNVIKERAPFWRASWMGEGVGFPEGILLTINLALVSLGVGAAWERNKLIGLLPVMIFLAYILSNALALTSGGRYITPVDWIICIYYMAGLFQVASWVFRRAGGNLQVSGLQLENISEPPAQSSIKYPQVFFALIIVFILGSVVPLSEMPFERRYKVDTVGETLALLEQKGMFENSSIDREALSVFLTDPLAKVLVGRLLYPRFYESGQGETDRHYPYVHLDYPRNVFQVIGPLDITVQNVIIAGGRSEFITHAADVVVIGCKNELNLDGLVVFVFSEPSYVYMRAPQPEWKCPLQAP